MKYFPIAHLIALVVGVIFILMLKRKYQKIHNRELIVILILYVILVALFTAPGMDMVKRFINFIQLD